MLLQKFISKQSLQQGAGVVFDQGLYSLTNFATGVLLARSLMKEEYGIYVLALSLIISIMGIQRAVITVPYTVYSQKHREGEFNTYTGSVFIHQIILLIIAVAFSLLFSQYFFLREGAAHNAVFILITFALAATGVLLRDFVRSYLLAQLAVRQSVIMGVSVNIIQLLILATLYVKDRLTIHNAFLIIGGCSVLPSLYFFLKNSQIRVKATQILNDFRTNLKLGKWILGSTIISTLASQAYPWLLVFFADKSSVAILGVSLSLANILGPLIQGMHTFLLPKMVKGKQEEGVKSVFRTTHKAMIILASLFGIWLICGILFGRSLLELIYTDKYSDYSIVLILLIINSLIAGISIPLNTALETLERADISFKSLSSGFAVTILLSPLLIYSYGIYGASIGILFSTIVSFLMRLKGIYYFKKLMKRGKN
jgi:O-antigen/teichoic acid export membrane protein